MEGITPKGFEHLLAKPIVPTTPTVHNVPVAPTVHNETEAFTFTFER